VDVPEIAGLQMMIHAITGDGVLGSSGTRLNATSTSFGVNSGASGVDKADRFDSAFSESVTFSFSQSVSISQLDFVGFDVGEQFSFGGQNITFSDLSNGSTDVITFSSPLVFAAGEQITISASSGTIGIEAMTMTAVPEPSTLALFAFSGGFLFLRRRSV